MSDEKPEFPRPPLKEIQHCQCGRDAARLVPCVGTVQIACTDCGRRTRICTNIDDAIADWNRMTAAPDLLINLKLAESTIQYALDNWAPTEQYKVSLAQQLKAFRAAIAKAEPKP